MTLASVDSALRISDASAHERQVAEGTGDQAWLDAAHVGDTTLLLTGDRLWTATARTIFWNRSIDDVALLRPTTTPFPPATRAVALGDDGVFRTADGEPLRRPIVVTPTTFTLAGERVAERPAGTSETPGLVAWRPDGDVRAVLRTEGFLPNGDFTGRATVTVYGCRPGTLDVTVLGKSGDPIDAHVDGIFVSRLETPPDGAMTHHIPTPPYADGTRACGFELLNPGYAGTTTIAFTPR
jgi:hypothetical protein